MIHRKLRWITFSRYFLIVGPIYYIYSMFTHDYSYETTVDTSEITDYTKYPLIDQEFFQRLDTLQNPSSCFERNLHIFDASVWPCGFGCHLHMLIEHMHFALLTNRSFIVRNSPLFKYLKPIGIDCQLKAGKPQHLNKAVFINTEEAHIRVREINSGYFNKTTQKQQSVAFLIGQFVGYIMQFNDRFKVRAARKAEQIGFQFDRCVGVHVRRTDKISEAKYYELSEYMQHVDEYFESHPNKRKCVFLMTDDAKVIVEAELNYYSKYEFIFGLRDDNSVFGRLWDKDRNLINIMIDIYFLSRCEYMVCTLSSNVARVVYEVWSLKYRDLSEQVVSLDEEYFHH